MIYEKLVDSGHIILWFLFMTIYFVVIRNSVQSAYSSGVSNSNLDSVYVRIYSISILVVLVLFTLLIYPFITFAMGFSWFYVLACLVVTLFLALMTLVFMSIVESEVRKVIDTRGKNEKYKHDNKRRCILFRWVTIGWYVVTAIGMGYMAFGIDISQVSDTYFVLYVLVLLLWMVVLAVLSLGLVKDIKKDEKAMRDKVTEAKRK